MVAAAVLVITTTTGVAATGHSQFAAIKNIICCETFTFLLSSCLWCCTSFSWCFCCTTNMLDFKVTSLLPLKGDELAIERKVIERESMPLCLLVWEWGVGACSGELRRVLYKTWRRNGIACTRTVPWPAGGKAEDKFYLILPTSLNLISLCHIYYSKSVA